MAKIAQPYLENGVLISKAALSEGDEVTVIYDGLLVGSGADMIFAHVGYGDNWDEKEFFPMENVDGTFSLKLKLKSSGSLNLSFKDSAENWDNNSFHNYSFKVTKSSALRKSEVIKDIPEKVTSTISKKVAKTLEVVKENAKPVKQKKVEEKENKEEAKKPTTKKKKEK